MAKNGAFLNIFFWPILKSAKDFYSMRNEINLSREQLQETAHNPNTVSKELGHSELEARNPLANECPFMWAAVAHLHCLAPAAAVLASDGVVLVVGGCLRQHSPGAIANGHNYWGYPMGCKRAKPSSLCAESVESANY